MGDSVELTPVMLDDIAKIAYQCRIVCSAMVSVAVTAHTED
jgi:hypothetical protein